MTAPTLASVMINRERYPDPGTRWDVTQLAMRFYLLTSDDVRYNFDRDTLAGQIEGLRRADSEYDYTVRLGAVREYALDESEFRDGSNSYDGTTAFLEAFDLDVPSRDTRKRVTVQARITFYVENDADAESTYADVNRYLSIDLSGNVDDAEFGDADVNIESIDVEDDD